MWRRLEHRAGVPLGCDAAPARRLAAQVCIGPFTVATLDDGSVWVHGHPPGAPWWRHREDGRVLPLDHVQVAAAAIDAAEDLVSLERWHRALRGRWAADPCAPGLLAWVERRAQQLAAPSILSRPPPPPAR